MNNTNSRTLNIGDKVLVKNSSGWEIPIFTTATVTKVTPSGQAVVQINPNYTLRFDKDGRQVGEKWHPQWLLPFDQSILDRQSRANRMQKHRRTLNDHDWNKDSDDLVLRVIDILTDAASGESEQ